MRLEDKNKQVYEAIARNLREFGYPDVTAKMIEETDTTRREGKANNSPHGIVSMFAHSQLKDAVEQGLLS